MPTDYQQLKSLSEIWLERNFDPMFYMNNMYHLVLSAALSNTDDSLLSILKNSPRKVLIVLLGFSIENIELSISILKPDHVVFITTKSVSTFHSAHFKNVVNILKKEIGKFSVDKKTVNDTDQFDVEQRIHETIRELILDQGIREEQIAIDLTGGTKLMSIGAQNVINQFSFIDGFYLTCDYDPKHAYPIPGSERLIRYKKSSLVEKGFVFIIMPFACAYNSIADAIIKACKNQNLDAQRADQSFSTQSGFIDKILAEINKAELVITEITEKNPNVYYELGIAHEKKKPVIMIANSLGDVPSDIKHRDILVYNNQSDLIQKLEKLIPNVISIS